MALPKTKPEFDVDAYMAWEDEQPERHEYLAGEVFAMSGGTDAHTRFCSTRRRVSKPPSPENPAAPSSPA